jgi:hypothetical protein
VNGRETTATVALVAAGALLAGFAAGLWTATLTRGTRTVAPRLRPEAEASDSGHGCGVERADVKHLTDGYTVPSTVVQAKPSDLVALEPPPVTRDSPRILTDEAFPDGTVHPAEGTLVELRGVPVVAVKREADSDLHVIIASDTGAVLNVEAPAARCVSLSPAAPLLARARAAMDAAMPGASSRGYKAVHLRATVRGMLFFDVLHGQRGAPNGVELHPVTCFAVEPRTC